VRPSQANDFAGWARNGGVRKILLRIVGVWSEIFAQVGGNGLKTRYYDSFRARITTPHLWKQTIDFLSSREILINCLSRVSVNHSPLPSFLFNPCLRGSFP